MKKILLISFLLCSLILGGNAQQHVYKLPLDNNQKNIKGQTFCYMLPATAFKVTVNITKVREIKGYYADYAQSLLGLTNIISENRTFYKVADIQIEPVQVPDTAQMYIVALSKAQMQHNLLSRLSNNDALMPTLTQEVQCYTTKATPIPNFFKNYSDLSYTEMEDSFVETKIIDGVVTQVPANRSKLVSKTISQKAQEAADAISKSRKDQYNIAAGEQETPYTEGSIELMLQELKEWEQNYLNLFTGLVLEDEMTYTFYVTPSASQSYIPLFTCNQESGFSSNVTNAAPAGLYTLNLTPVYTAEQMQQLADNNKQPLKAQESGYRIRKAMPVNVTLSLANKELFDFGTFNMSQFGCIQILPLQQNHLKIQTIGFIY